MKDKLKVDPYEYIGVHGVLSCNYPPLKPKLTIILGKKDRNGQKIVQRSLSTSAKLGCCPAKKLYCFCLLVSQILCPRSIFNTFNLFVPKKIESYFPKRKKKRRRMKSELFLSVTDDAWWVVIILMHFILHFKSAHIIFFMLAQADCC